MMSSFLMLLLISSIVIVCFACFHSVAATTASVPASAPCRFSARLNDFLDLVLKVPNSSFPLNEIYSVELRSLLKQSYAAFSLSRDSLIEKDKIQSMVFDLLSKELCNVSATNNEGELSVPPENLRMEQLLQLFEQLYQFETRLHEEKYVNASSDKEGKHQDMQKAANRTVIVGAGPVGLLSALEVQMNIMKRERKRGKKDKINGDTSLTLLEKRTRYTRSVWFDFYPKPYSVASDFLFDLGWNYQDIEHERIAVDSNAASGTVILVRCQVLEHFLSKILLIYGVDVRYGVEYKKHNDTHVFAEDRSGVEYTIPFDLLVATDGSNSLVRRSANIDTRPVTSFNVLTKGVEQTRESVVFKRLTVPNLHQTALVINLAPIYNVTSGQFVCPRVKTDSSSGESIDPWSPTFNLKGISSIFKRFYHGHCHIQILFENEIGGHIVERYGSVRTTKGNEREVAFAVHDNIDIHHQRDDASLPCKAWELEAYPWNDILLAMGEILDEAPPNQDQLIRMIQRKAETNELDMTLWNVAIKRASQSYQKLDHGGAIIVHGDAFATAHFRLGVGVNNAFISYGSIFTRYLSGLGTIDDIMRKQDERWSALINYMTSTMFFESYCNNVVFFNTNAKAKWQSNGDDHLETVWYRDYLHRSFEQFRTVDQLLRSCPRRYYSIVS